MASKTKRYRYYKNICLQLLRTELVLCIFLIVLTIGLQIYNIVFPPQVSAEVPPVLGSFSFSFSLNASNCFPFLMIPMLLLVLGAILLQNYFVHNGFGFSDNIAFFNKHPHTRLNKKVCKWFVVFVSAVSFALAVISTLAYSIYTPWFGFFITAVTACLHYFCAKLLRHRRRQYWHNKKKTKGAA